jgi:hypothetical protein
MKGGRSATGSTTLYDRVHAVVLHELLFRRRPTLERLADAAGVPVVAVSETLAMLTARGACVADGTGAIVAAYPLSAVRTPHVVDLRWAAPWANCAIDALAVPAMVGERGTIASACALCGSPIAISVEDSSLLSADPADVVVAFGGLTDCGDRPALEACCPYITFFCGTTHASDGSLRHPGVVSFFRSTRPCRRL